MHEPAQHGRRYLTWEAITDMISWLRSWPTSCPPGRAGQRPPRHREPDRVERRRVPGEPAV